VYFVHHVIFYSESESKKWQTSNKIPLIITHKADLAS
jgi:hypothetical protein